MRYSHFIACEMDGVGVEACNIPEWVVRGFASELLRAVRECLEDPQNMEEFKRWHLEYYGYEYVPQKFEENEVS